MVVRNLKTLKAMAKAGLITLHKDTGKMVGTAIGGYCTAHYVANLCNGVPSEFIYNNKIYHLEYFDGCFCPYVVQIGERI